MLALILLSISISDHSDRAHSLRVQNWEGWFIHQRLCCHSEGPTQAGEIQLREKPSPAPGEEPPQAPVRGGGHPAWWKRAWRTLSWMWAFQPQPFGGSVTLATLSARWFLIYLFWGKQFIFTLSMYTFLVSLDLVISKNTTERDLKEIAWWASWGQYLCCKLK